MIRPPLSRRSVLGFGVSGAVAAAIAVGALAPWQSRKAEAQTEPVQPETDFSPEHYDPALAEVDPALSGTDPGLVAPDLALTSPATPVVTPEASLALPTGESADAVMTTRLGGSDVAVASEGESHQVDAPKRKANKIRGEKKRP